MIECVDYSFPSKALKRQCATVDGANACLINSNHAAVTVCSLALLLSWDSPQGPATVL